MSKKKFRYIPLRYVIAMLITILEILLIIGVAVYLSYKFQYFYFLAILTQIICAVKIIASSDNPDYQVPWLVVVLVLPITGFMLYFIFSSKKLNRKYLKRLKEIVKNSYYKNDEGDFELIKSSSVEAYNQFNMLSKISGAHLFSNTESEYFGDMNKLLSRLICDLENAKSFIFLEFFIIDGGEFWNKIHNILIKKAQNGVDVRVVFDDIGCMKTLPSNYQKILSNENIKAVTFSRLKVAPNGEFNNRNHRKMIIIDGIIGYTGGFNLADEYLNLINRFGFWKDCGLRLYGEGVWEFTKLFLIDYEINKKSVISTPYNYFPKVNVEKFCGFVMPFGDGPKPLYPRQVSKSVIQNLLACAKKSVYITTPYLIVDNDLLTDIENASLRGVDVRIVVPHIPDKKLIYLMTKSYYPRLLSAGVKIYEYTPGFIHQKVYFVDGKYAMVGTVNLDYRSLVHHFENGVLLYKTKSINQVKKDLLAVFESCKLVNEQELKNTIFQRFICSLVSIFAPLM